MLASFRKDELTAVIANIVFSHIGMCNYMQSKSFAVITVCQTSRALQRVIFERLLVSFRYAYPQSRLLISSNIHEIIPEVHVKVSKVWYLYYMGLVSS